MSFLDENEGSSEEEDVDNDDSDEEEETVEGYTDDNKLWLKPSKWKKVKLHQMKYTVNPHCWQKKLFIIPYNPY
jgi:hypothetical protein